MTCSKCRHYSYSLHRCKLGKANPKTKKGAEDVVRFMGAAGLCPHSKWKITVAK